MLEGDKGNMKIVDNFELLKNFMTFTDVDDYYFIQIMQRSKDVPGLGSSNHVIKTYTVRSKEYFEKHIEEIKTLCQTFTARAYLHPVKRSFKEVSLLMLSDLADRIRTNQLETVANLFSTASGRYKGNDKLFLVDIDEGDPSELEIEQIIADCQPDKGTSKVVLKVPTVNGVHLICKPFDVSKFCELVPGMDIHKNNPTLLYACKKE